MVVLTRLPMAVCEPFKRRGQFIDPKCHIVEGPCGPWLKISINHGDPLHMDDRAVGRVPGYQHTQAATSIARERSRTIARFTVLAILHFRFCTILVKAESVRSLLHASSLMSPAMRRFSTPVLTTLPC